MKLTAFSRPDQNWLRAFMFTIFGTTALVISYFPLYYKELGFTSSQIGYLYAVGPLISMFSNMIWSLASDKYQTLKKIMIILISGQLFMLLAMTGASGFTPVFLIITIFYFFYYPVYPLADTMAIQTAQRYGRSFTVIRVFGSLGYAFFALGIGYVISVAGASWTLGIGIGIGIAALLSSLLLRDGVMKRSESMGMSDLLKVLRSKEILWFFACVFCLALAHRMNEAFLTLTLSQLGAGEGLIGWSLMISAISEIPIFYLLSKYGDKIKELPLLGFASLMYALRFLLMGLANDPISVLAIQTLHSVTFGVFYVTAVRYITRLVPGRYRATGIALFTVFWSSASGLISGTFGGMMFETAGRTYFYYLATVLAFVAALGFLGRHLFAKPMDTFVE
ncbi:MFS transporter, PPP family, 3-phenylpropionic acid transporter [Paenibacillus uliginis N3/975]|uniref:MFS transporter, PPP family, 3-phenylpropionic acid transporter n=1 Tax=Paenibacillus uliginis N3/975 TaxID=1313296 RepID=A0A1X7H3P2_9BACL|nr:MFS transporter [Paenibacillus uliginis]SMF78394.1 MFS transporter, PPP family, 3-phenylpropionic acid transporter [Paenibacillus uliginis N3/975]